MLLMTFVCNAIATVRTLASPRHVRIGSGIPREDEVGDRRSTLRRFRGSDGGRCQRQRFPVKREDGAAIEYRPYERSMEWP